MADSKLKNRLLRALAFLFFITLLVLLDQWTKHLAIIKLRESRPFVLIEGVLEFSYLENTGAAFGSLKGARWLFLIFAPTVSAVLFFFSMKFYADKRMRPLAFCFLFIIAGAVGNFIDRLNFGYVVDFIYFRLIDFPVFNVADIYVTCASAVLILLILFKYKDEDFGKKPDLPTEG